MKSIFGIADKMKFVFNFRKSIFRPLVDVNKGASAWGLGVAAEELGGEEWDCEFVVSCD